MRVLVLHAPLLLLPLTLHGAMGVAHRVVEYTLAWCTRVRRVQVRYTRRARWQRAVRTIGASTSTLPPLVRGWVRPLVRVLRRIPRRHRRGKLFTGWN